MTAIVRPALPSYAAAARRFHWLTVGLIVPSLAIVWTDRWFGDPAHEAMVTLHRSLGLTIAAVTVLRLAYRRMNPPPELALAPWEAAIARATHYALYALLLITPLLGWLDSEFAAQTTHLFYLADLPHLLARSETGVKRAYLGHQVAVYALVVLVVLHASAALFHHYVRHDSVLRRMLGGRDPART